MAFRWTQTDHPDPTAFTGLQAAVAKTRSASPTLAAWRPSKIASKLVHQTPFLPSMAHSSTIRSLILHHFNAIASKDRHIPRHLLLHTINKLQAMVLRVSHNILTRNLSSTTLDIIHTATLDQVRMETTRTTTLAILHLVVTTVYCSQHSSHRVSKHDQPPDPCLHLFISRYSRHR